MYAIYVANDGRILAATFPKYADGDTVTVDTLPEGDITDWRYFDGEYVYDPLPEPEPVEPEENDSVWDALDAAYQEGVNSL